MPRLLFSSISLANKLRKGVSEWSPTYKKGALGAQPPARNEWIIDSYLGTTTVVIDAPQLGNNRLNDKDKCLKLG